MRSFLSDTLKFNAHVSEQVGNDELNALAIELQHFVVEKPDREGASRLSLSTYKRD
ncbi:hypothetical protein AB4392_05225 [Vibrio breoganii]